MQELRLRTAILSGLGKKHALRDLHQRHARELLRALALESSPTAPLLIDPPVLGAMPIG